MYVRGDGNIIFLNQKIQASFHNHNLKKGSTKSLSWDRLSNLPLFVIQFNIVPCSIALLDGAGALVSVQDWKGGRDWRTQMHTASPALQTQKISKLLLDPKYDCFKIKFHSNTDIDIYIFIKNYLVGTAHLYLNNLFRQNNKRFFSPRACKYCPNA